MANDLTFIVEKQCPICEQTTRIVKARVKAHVIQVDEDLCNHFEGGFNPYFYNIWVCEHCAFAGDEKHFLKTIHPKHKLLIKKLIEEKHNRYNFVEERKVPDAVAAFRLAALYAEVMKLPLFTLAGIYLRTAWIFRYSKEEAKETAMLTQAAETYEQSVQTERYPQGNMTEFDADYMIAAIYFRLGNKDKYRSYLSSLMGNKELKVKAPQVYTRAKKLWEYVREEDKRLESMKQAAEERELKRVGKSNRKK